jgi:hypothetical protein
MVLKKTEGCVTEYWYLNETSRMLLPCRKFCDSHKTGRFVSFVKTRRMATVSVTYSTCQ